MPRFLHTADWQIGRQFASFDPEQAPLLALPGVADAAQESPRLGFAAECMCPTSGASARP